MNKLFVALLLIVANMANVAHGFFWEQEYQALLIEKLSQKVPLFSTYPALKYPNAEVQKILDKYPGKIPIFGYGSLMNPTSASRSISPEAVQSMRPVVAFRLKRIFNKDAGDVTKRRPDLKENERAFLNVEPTTTYGSVINGVVLEATPSDLAQLIQRERGYDLVPILVVDWGDIMARKPSPHIQIAYTFITPPELRQGVNYIRTTCYPIRFYLRLVQEGAATYGDDFLNFWNASTYMGDGTTLITHWDQQAFTGILDAVEP